LSKVKTPVQQGAVQYIFTTSTGNSVPLTPTMGEATFATIAPLLNPNVQHHQGHVVHQSRPSERHVVVNHSGEKDLLPEGFSSSSGYSHHHPTGHLHSMPGSGSITQGTAADRRDKEATSRSAVSSLNSSRHSSRSNSLDGARYEVIAKSEEIHNSQQLPVVTNSSNTKYAFQTFVQVSFLRNKENKPF